jgi:hypothetical protein
MEYRDVWRNRSTNQNYIDTHIDGIAQIAAGGDINISDSGSLTLIADSSNGQVNVNAVSDLNLSNTTGNLVIGAITQAVPQPLLRQPVSLPVTNWAMMRM